MCPLEFAGKGNAGSLRRRACCFGLFSMFVLAGAIGPGQTFAGVVLHSESAEDLMLTVLARRALLADRDLAGLNLGVRVKQREATLWGPVPSLTLMQRALAMMSTLPELVQIRNEMHIANDDERFSVPTLPGPMPLPRRPVVLSDAVTPHAAAGTTTSASPGTALPEGAWQTSRPEQDPRMPDHREFETVLPSLRLPTPPLSEPAAAALDRTITNSANDLRRDPRFLAIEITVKDAVATLAGEPSPALYDLARAVSHLPGVQRVVVKERR